MQKAGLTMGYSCSAKADYVLKALITQLQSASSKEVLTSNSWIYKNTEYFYEIGKENKFGDITGKVMRSFNKDGTDLCKYVGNFHIDSDGDIWYFPTTERSRRDSAITSGLIKFHEVHGGRWQDDKLLSSLIGDAKFVVI